MFFSNKWLIAFTMIFAGGAAQAQLPSFNNLSQTQVETLVGEFGAANAHTSVSGATSLGTVFGIEAGVVAGILDSAGIKEIVDAVNPGTNTEVAAIPHASVLVAASFPLGFGAEATFLPSLDLSDITMERTGLAGKWTVTDAMLSLPVDVAIKAHYTTYKFAYSQTAQGSSVASNISIDSNILGADLMVGKNLNLLLAGVEVWGSVGFVKADGDFSSTVDIFDATVTGLTANASNSGLDIKAGAAVKLLLFKVGVEYQNILGGTRYNFKLSAKF